MYIWQCFANNNFMFNAKKIFKTLLVCFATVVIAFIFSPFSASAYAQTESLYLGGFPAGFVLNTKNVEVIGLCEVLTDGGISSPARDAGIRTGDIIEAINGEKVTKTSDINDIISRNYKKYEINVKRGSESITFEIEPVKELSSGAKRIGVLVKDSINGVGTVTYIDGENGKFASLGHPVTDTDNKLIEINGGTLFGSIIYDVKKGIRGAPGELHGAFESGVVIGSAKLNCPCGVFGTLAKDYDYSKLVKIEKGTINDVNIGSAYIYSTVYGKQVEKYKISIAKVDANNKDNRNFVIKVEDKNLIEKTGGIVQGMSGSPIVQNGKLIGAVTHVMINDPTRGYGIGIEHMLNAY